MNVLYIMLKLIYNHQNFITLIDFYSSGLHNPLDTLYHLQPFMTLTIIPLAFYIEG